MNTAKARAWLAKEPEVRAGMVWTPLPICERLFIRWEAVDLVAAVAPGRVRVEDVFARQRWLRVATLKWLLDELDAGRFGHWGTDEIVTFWQGAAYVVDGHHRFAIRSLAELTEMDGWQHNCRTVTLTEDGRLPSRG
jgi:hypothetical protein